MADSAPPDWTSYQRTFGGKRVLITGHTGFKGSWLAVWLAAAGAEVTGYGLPPTQTPNLFTAADVAAVCRHMEGDVRDRDEVTRVVSTLRPEFLFHLAAQPIVRESYADPAGTIETNVMGTVNVLDAVRAAGGPCAVVVVTTDKCYENRGWDYGYREEDRLGGHDPYSMSKAACELVVSSYRRSFFPPDRLAAHGITVATARAGNVIGGGDWAVDRIVPDAVRALTTGQPITVRNPHAVRPWQHVLEALGGYLALAMKLSDPDRGRAAAFGEAWNFGPTTEQTRSVRDLVTTVIEQWGSGEWVSAFDPTAVHEAPVLRLSIDKAWARLGWQPHWDFRDTVAATVEWYRHWHGGAGARALRELCLTQIRQYVPAGS